MLQPLLLHLILKINVVLQLLVQQVLVLYPLEEATHEGLDVGGGRVFFFVLLEEGLAAPGLSLPRRYYKVGKIGIELLSAVCL